MSKTAKSICLKEMTWMKKGKNVILLMGVLIFLIALICIYESNRKEMYTKSTQVNAGIENFSKLDNKKIGWGIKRKDNHEQPDVGKVNQEIIEKYNGICLGNIEQKYIYLTFDYGFEAGYTEKILDVLKENNVKATFFITAHYINTASDLVQRMIDEGHIIGNHTVNHKSMPTITLEQIKPEVMDLHQMMYTKYQYEMKYIRPPKGEYSERTVAYTNSLGYQTVMWSFAYDDWEESKQGREEYAKKKIFDNLHNGEVMLLHGTSKDNANILDEVIKKTKEMGYEFKSLDEFER